MTKSRDCPTFSASGQRSRCEDAVERRKQHLEFGTRRRNACFPSREAQQNIRRHGDGQTRLPSNLPGPAAQTCDRDDVSERHPTQMRRTGRQNL